MTGPERSKYIAQVQKILKGYDCYGGQINGDLEDANAGLTRFVANYRGIVRQINLTSATINDYEEWLNWSKGLNKFSCPSEEPPPVVKRRAPKSVQKPQAEPRETEKETRRPSKEARSPEPRQRREQPQRSYSNSPGRGSGGGGGGTMMGVGN